MDEKKLQTLLRLLETELAWVDTYFAVLYQQKLEMQNTLASIEDQTTRLRSSHEQLSRILAMLKERD